MIVLRLDKEFEQKNKFSKVVKGRDLFTNLNNSIKDFITLNFQIKTLD